MAYEKTTRRSRREAAKRKTQELLEAGFGSTIEPKNPRLGTKGSDYDRVRLVAIEPSPRRGVPATAVVDHPTRKTRRRRIRLSLENIRRFVPAAPTEYYAELLGAPSHAPRPAPATALAEREAA